MSRLGNGDINLPFEPSSGSLAGADADFSGGLVVLAVVVPVPEVGPMPGLMFRFARPDGTFMRPVVLVAEPDEIIGAGVLVTQAASAAVKAAS